MRTLELNGVTFKVTKPRNPVRPFSGWFCDENAIYNCYDRPSEYKVAIWNDWLKWARETDGVTGFEISSYNCMQFTISGFYVDENGNEYNIYITKSRNELIKVN